MLATFCVEIFLTLLWDLFPASKEKKKKKNQSYIIAALVLMPLWTIFQIYIGLKTPWIPPLTNSLEVVHDYRLFGEKREKCCNERTDYSLKAKQGYEERRKLDFVHRTRPMKFNWFVNNFLCRLRSMGSSKGICIKATKKQSDLT